MVLRGKIREGAIGGAIGVGGQSGGAIGAIGVRPAGQSGAIGGQSGSDLEIVFKVISP